MKLLTGGDVRTVTGGKALISGTVRTLTRAQAKIGGSVVTIVRFLGSLAVSAPDALGVASSSGTTTVTATLEATPTGGLGPYSYAWTRVSGAPVTFNTPAMASTSCSADLEAGASQATTARVTVTDALGATAFVNITVTLRNAGGTA